MEGVYKGTEPISLIASKKNNDIREFKIPNPMVQVALNWYIFENKTFLDELQIDDNENFACTSKFYFIEDSLWSKKYDEFNDEDQEIIASITFKPAQWRNETISNGKYYKLDLDMSNCYDNIYTHAVSWLVEDNTDKENLNNLDVLIRNTNNNETKSIIVGPYTSGLFAELVLSQFDKKIYAWIKKENLNVSFTRYVDDISIYSDSKEILEEKILFKIQDILLETKQSLNPSKTNITEFPYQNNNVLLKKFVSEFISEVRDINQRIDDLDPLIDEDYDYDLLNLNQELLEYLIYSINRTLEKGINECKYFLTTLLNKLKDNSDLFCKDFINDRKVYKKLMDYLLNLMFKFNILSEKVGYLIEYLLDNTNLDTQILLENWIQKRYNRKSHLKEIVDLWLSYLILKSDVISTKITAYFLDILEESDMCSLLSLEYLSKNDMFVEKKTEIKNYLNNIKIRLKNQYGDQWVTGAWLSKYWLLFYTNMRRWKVHEIKGFRNSIFKKTHLSNLDTRKDGKPHLYMYLIYLTD